MSNRSILLDGAVTSISLEDSFWEELDRYSRARGLGWADVVREWLAITPPAVNRSASIKETIVHLLRHEIDELQTDGKRTRWSIRLPGVKEPHVVETFWVRLILGREQPADVILEDDEVSRRHAMLVNDGERWWVVDLKSKNGTLVRGKRTEVAAIDAGTEFTIGQSSIRLAAHGRRS